MAKLVETVNRAGSFSTLVAALRSTGLANVLKAHGPFTLFAPDDDAFAGVAPSILEGLLENPEDLKRVLSCLVVPDIIESRQIRKRCPRRVGTLGDTPVTLDATMQGRVMVNNACITQADLPADNGVIHVIDRLILPRSLCEQAGTDPTALTD